MGILSPPLPPTDLFIRNIKRERNKKKEKNKQKKSAVHSHVWKSGGGGQILDLSHPQLDFLILPNVMEYSVHKDKLLSK